MLIVCERTNQLQGYHPFKARTPFDYIISGLIELEILIKLVETDHRCKICYSLSTYMSNGLQIESGVIMQRAVHQHVSNN
jgi:hypothetical protein